MKKAGTILVILLIIITGMWFYLANKFEKIVLNELLPIITDSNDPIMKADLNSVVIKKFKFKLTLKSITIFPRINYLKVKSDEITIGYNPFTDNIYAHFNGKKLSVGTGKTKVYILNPNQTIEFNHSIFKNGLKDIDLKITSKNLSIYLANNDELISKTANSKFKFSNSLKSDEFYYINLDVDLNDLKMNTESKYLINLLKKLVPKSTQRDLSLNKKDLQIINYCYKIAKKSNPINYNTKYSIKLGKEHVNNIIASIKGEKKLLEAYSEFNFTEDNYSLEVIEHTTNSVLNHSSSLSFTGDGKKIIANVNTILQRSYTNEQKRAITNITNILLKSSAINILNTLNIDLDVTNKDFKKLAEKLTNLEKVIIDFNINYDITSSNLNHSLDIGINNFLISTIGAVKNKIYVGQTNITTPSIMINNIFDTYESTLKPFLEKITNKTNKLRLQPLNQLMNNIKDNGFNALAVFHKESELKENDPLITDITVNLKGFNLKINNIAFFKLLTDERLVKFLKKMPEEEI